MERCALMEMPYELLELIIGGIRIIDLPNVLRSSKRVQVPFLSRTADYRVLLMQHLIDDNYI